MILINTTDQNIWIRQPLLATELFEVEMKSQQNHAEMDSEGDEIIMSYQPVPPHEKQDQVESNVVEVELKQEENDKDTLSLSYPKFRKRSIIEETYNFESETAWLAFRFNLGMLHSLKNKINF